MSLDLYQGETLDSLSGARPVQSVEPGVFTNFIPGTAKLTMRGFAAAGSGIDILGGSLAAVQDKILGTGTEAQDRYFKEHDDVFGSAVKYWTPEPNEVGMAAEVTAGLLSTLPLVIANPATAIASTQAHTAEDLVSRGVPAEKAQAVGALSGATLGLGVWMPILGGNLWQRVVLGGAGYNVGQGLITRAASRAILSGTAAEEDFKAFDGKALTLDALMGMAFGTLAHISPAQRAQGAHAWERLTRWAEEWSPSERDSVMALRQAEHMNVDSAPGKLATPRDVEAHVQRMKTAIDQLAKGDQVAVDTLPAASAKPDASRDAAEAKTLENLQKIAERVRVDEGLPLTPDQTATAAFGGREAPAGAFPVSDVLKSAEERDVEARTWKVLFSAPEVARPEMIEAYNKLPDTEGGKIIATDVARELAPDYVKSKEARLQFAQAIHEPTSAFAKALYAARLAAPSESGENVVTLMSGGSGSGKSAALHDTPEAKELLKTVDAVYDTNSANYDTTQKKVDQALAAGKKVTVLYVGRDPVESIDGTIERSKVAGRVLPIDLYEHTHTGSVDVMKKLFARYGADDPKIQFLFLDNSRGAGKAKLAGPELLDQFDFTNLNARLREKVDAEHAAGRIPQNIYDKLVEDAGGPAGAARGGVSQPERQASDLLGDREARGVRAEAPAAAGRGVTEPPPPRGSAAAEAAGVEVRDPIMAEAERVAAEQPDMPIRLGTDADGNPISTTLAQFLHDARMEAEKLREQGKLLGVAAQCLQGVL